MDNGGPAFPRPASEDKFNEENYPPQCGMSLRDWFAGQALAGSSASPDQWILASRQENPFEGMARICYRIADAMLAEREKQRTRPTSTS